MHGVGGRGDNGGNYQLEKPLEKSRSLQESAGASSKRGNDGTVVGYEIVVFIIYNVK